MLRGVAASACLLILFVGVTQAQTLTCDRGVRGGTPDRRTVTFDCTGTIPQKTSATTTPNWSRFLLPTSRFSSARLTVNSPTPGETRVKVEGQFQGANGNNIKTCQTRRGLILPGDADLTAGAAAATIMTINVNSTETPQILADDHKENMKHDGYKGDEGYNRMYDDDHKEYRKYDGYKGDEGYNRMYDDGHKEYRRYNGYKGDEDYNRMYDDGHKGYKRYGGYKGDEGYDRMYDDDHKEYRRHDGYKGDEDEYKRSHEYDSHDSHKKMKPFKGVDVVFSPVVVAPDAPPAAKKRDGDKSYEEDEDEYEYNEQDAEYYSVKFDDWEDASTEQVEPGRFGNDVRQCRPKVRGNAQASIAAATPQQKNRQPETPAALRLTIHCKQPPQGRQECDVRARLVVAFTGDLADVAK